MLSARRLAPLPLLALTAAAACSSNQTTSGTTSSAATTTGAGGSTTTATTTAGTGGSTATTTTTTGTGGSGGSAPHGCQAFALSGDPDAPVDATVPPASAGGLAWDGTHYEAVYTGTVPTGFNVYLTLLGPKGAIVSPPGMQSLSLIGSDATGGPVVAAGNRQGVLWSDRRTGDYEIFFAALQGNGVKLWDDLRLSNAKGFSINPTLAFTGSEHVAIWQDDRGGDFHLFGQRITMDGMLTAGNVELTMPPAGTGDQAPSAAAGDGGLGVAYIEKGPAGSTLVFRLIAADLTPAAPPPITVEDAMGTPGAPVVVWDFDRYVIAWQDTDAPSKAIRAMAVGPDGATLVPPTEVTVPGAHASRAPALLALGDSLLLVYADDRDQNGGFEIYARTLSLSLAPLSDELRVTSAMGDSLGPKVAMGPGGATGEAGILFQDNRAGGQNNIFFARLVCKGP